MTGRTQLAGAMLLLFSVALAAQVPKKLRRMEARYAHQKDAVRRAKTMAKLLPAEVRVAAEEIQEGEYSQGVARLQRWSGQAQQVQVALAATGRNAVKRPDGFTELQVGLRESLRGMRNIIFSLPLGRRRPAESVQANLRQINHHLLQELFPPPPPPQPRKKKKRK